MEANIDTVTKNYLKIAWPFLVAAFIIRLLVLLIINSPTVGDQQIFQQLGFSLADGAGFSDENGHPTGFLAPGYPFFVSLFYSTFGLSNFPVKLTQVLISIVTLAIIGYFSYKVDGKFTARIALAFGLLYPSDIFYAQVLYSETLSALGVVLIVFLLFPYLMEKMDIHLSQSAFIRWGIAGLIASGLGLIRPLFLLLIPLLAISVCIVQKNKKRFIILLAAFALTVSIIPSGYWSIRNNSLFGVPWPASNTGTQFWIGNHEGTTGGYPWASTVLPTETRQLESYNLFVHSATKYIFSQPQRFIKSIPFKLRYGIGSDYGPIVESFFNDEFDRFPLVTERVPLMLLLFNWFMHTVIFFAGFAAWMFGPRGNWRHIIAAGLSVPILVSMIFYGLPRLFFPFTPLMILAASQLPVDHDKFYLGSIYLRFSFMILGLLLIFTWGIEAAAFLSLI